MEKFKCEVRILYGESNYGTKPDNIELDSILCRDSFLKVLEGSKDVNMVKYDYHYYSWSGITYDFNVLILEEGVTEIKKVSFRDINTFVFLGNKGIPSIPAFYCMNVNRVICINAGFLNGVNYLVEGCKYIIENFSEFNDKDNFVKKLKGKSNKITNLINDLVCLNNPVIIQFLIDNNIASYEFLLNASNMDIEQETKVYISNAIANLNPKIKKDFENKNEKKNNLDLGIESYTLKDFKEYFACSVKGDTIIISKYKGKEEKVLIPVVNNITKFEFKYIGKNNSIKQIFFEEGITDIYINKDSVEKPFQDCLKLEEISFPNTLKMLDYELLADLNLNSIIVNNVEHVEHVHSYENLIINKNKVIFVNNKKDVKQVVVPKYIKYLSNEIFSGCENLSKVVLPDDLVSIGDGTFKDCKSLKSIDIPKSITSLGRETFFGCSILDNVTISSNVTILGDSVFEDCDSLTKIVIPETVSQIGVNAFKGCELLNSVNLPSNFKDIPDRIFQNCNSLKEFVISKNIKHIGEKSFSGSGIKYIEIPDKCFMCCRNLKEVALHDQLQTIGNYAFYDCGSIESIQIPNSVDYIGDSAFESCTSLKEVKLSDNLETIERDVFRRCSSLVEIEIPESVKSIEFMSFDDCISLKTVKFPSGKINIHDKAFSRCKKLKNKTQ